MAHKICANCGEKCPARIRKCKNCNSTFAFKVKKKKPKSQKVENWCELAVGDYIKVSGGPVWMGKDGIDIPMGYTGVFIVKGFDSNGIIACGVQNSGFCHLWMASEKMSDMGVLKKPHKISRLKDVLD